MQSVVSGRASRRLIEMSSPHSSHVPNEPSSIFASALVILSKNDFSRPRSRNVNDCRYSLDARSISSGRSLASRVMSSSSVCLAFLMISSRFSSSKPRNFLSWALFMDVLRSRYRAPFRGRCLPQNERERLSTGEPPVNATRDLELALGENPHCHLEGAAVKKRPASGGEPRIARGISYLGGSS